MNFADYEMFIKKNMMDKISDEDLVNMLLGTIVDYFQIKTGKGEPYYFDKAETSKILKGKRKISRKLISRIDNLEFTNTLPEFFTLSVIPRLKYDHKAIMEELLKFVTTDDGIASETKLFCQMAANNGNMALLLAYVFIYSLKKTDGEIDAEEDKHTIYLEGMDEYCAPAKKMKLVKVTDIYRDGIENHSKNAVQMLEDINKICRAEANRKKYLGIASMLEEYHMKPISSLQPRVRISIEETQMIYRYVDMYGIQLDDNFFDLGDLRKETDGIFQNRPPEYSGNPLYLRKYKKLNALLADIKYLENVKITTEIFGKCYILNLLIHNNSKETVNGARIKFTLPENILYLDEDFCCNDIELLHELRKADTLDELLAIQKHPEYLAYNETTDGKMTSANKFFIYDYDKEYYRDLWNDRYEAYFIRKVNGGVYVELAFDAVPGNTTVAFPASLLLKDKISSISYEIVAASPYLAVEGKITTEE